jgi:uncharacterized protein with GYD domain
MPKYLAKARFSSEGLKGLRSAGAASREEMNRIAVQSLGGTLEAFYFAFGEFDMYAIIDFPDDEAAAAASLAVNTVGAVQVEVVKLLTPRQVDAALALTPEYRPPTT